MERLTQQQYSFGPFVLDPAEKVLLRHGQPVSLAPKVFEVLLALVEAHGHVLEKAALLGRVWPDTFVEEGTLAQDIFTLRKVLGETGEGREYVETVPKRGYRFIAPVEEIIAERARPAPAIVASRAAPFSYSHRLRWGVPALAVLAVVAGYFAWRVATGRAPPAAARVMMAVLPFENLTGDPQQEYFSEGLTEEMITRLGGLDPARLGVIARTSAMHYKGTTQRASEIGRELGVGYLLEGSVRREGPRVRISAQLIRVRDETHLWAENYDRDLRDVLQLDSDVAGAIAREIEIKLSPQALARLASAHRVDPEAFQLYLKGRYFWNKRNTEGLHKAVEYFQQAVAQDPNFALAYSGLADCYSLEDYFQDIRPAERRTRAKAAALKAVELDDTLAEAHTSMAMAGGWDRKPAETEAHFKRALELNPNYATAHHWYGLFLKDTGRTEEAIVEIQRAKQLDPLSLVINADVGLVYYFARRYDKAIEQCQKTLEMEPNFRLAHWELGMAYEEKRMYPEAIREYETAVRLSPDYPLMSTYLARAYALAGRRNEAWKIVRELEQLRPVNWPVGALAPVYDALGDKDQAFAWLERGVEADKTMPYWALQVDPRFDNLRLDPRFSELMRRIGLPSSR